jgi:hypothetical protein
MSKVEQNDLKVRDANKVVDDVASALKGPKSQSVYPVLATKRTSEVETGGSLGQGTTVPGNFDVDLIFLSRDITPEEMLDTHGAAKALVDDLKRFIEHSFGCLLPSGVKTVVARGILLLQFSLLVAEHNVVVDVDLTLGPLWEDIYESARFISRFKLQHQDDWDEYRSLFSPSISKWQKDFIIGQPNRVKELIRRAKKWQKQQWASDRTDGKPTSYLIAILMVEACRRWCETKGIKVEQLGECQMSSTTFERFVIDVQHIFADMVRKHQQLRLFNSPWFSWTNPGQTSRYTSVDTKPGQPYVLDPANPFHNLYEAGVKPCAEGRAPGETHNWGAFVAKITTLNLTRSLFD